MRLKKRPFGIIALVLLFVTGTAASLISVIALIFPGSFLESIWRLNPQAREGFERLGGWSIPLMLAVCLACLLAVIGLWRGLRWGYWLTFAMLIINLGGSVVNVITGMQRGAAAGIPIVLGLLLYLMRGRTREYFNFPSARRIG